MGMKVQKSQDMDARAQDMGVKAQNKCMRVQYGF